MLLEVARLGLVEMPRDDCLEKLDLSRSAPWPN
jgi:hypothetical protein